MFIFHEIHGKLSALGNQIYKAFFSTQFHNLSYFSVSWHPLTDGSEDVEGTSSSACRNWTLLRLLRLRLGGPDDGDDDNDESDGMGNVNGGMEILRPRLWLRECREPNELLRAMATEPTTLLLPLAEVVEGDPSCPRLLRLKSEGTSFSLVSSPENQSTGRPLKTQREETCRSSP